MTVLGLLGIFVGKLLSIAGVGGLISGLFIKNWPMAAGAGVALGVLDTLVLGSLTMRVAPISWIMAILVAVLMATLGWWLRGRKRA